MTRTACEPRRPDRRRGRRGLRQAQTRTRRPVRGLWIHAVDHCHSHHESFGPCATIRIDVDPSEANGLNAPSQLMIDKMASVHRTKIGQRIGVLDPATLGDVDRALAAFLGLA